MRDFDEIADEQLGTKEKFWAYDKSGQQWLIKFARGRGPETRGEDWAEWVVQHLAEDVGIPHAEILPVRHEHRRAIASRNVLREDSSQRLVLGNGLLSEISSGYEEEIGRRNPGYSVPAIKQALSAVDQPISFVGPGELTGFDVFTGYLLLDAWVSGRDRHHENWAIIDESGRRTLSPSYDHGNALGFQERDSKRERCLEVECVFAKWIDRGTSPHFVGKPTLVKVASDALALATPAAHQHWRSKFSSIDLRSVEAVIDSVPRDVMSEVTASFTKQLLQRNLGRLHDALGRFD
ncbi:hypothetical protein [Pseudoclavibacter sp. 8L]|uniref:hypothetical protein n=1 Tax=Pseudoclavibacter sp. 8L TaxID=2653162 RepID=UPI0012F3E475|nr:hypothetical protein [Pseudoclavibacter sp. 8L]VXA94739.1 conserved hypothetical protein [Pseudoclavibacter sp. 8L]